MKKISKIGLSALCGSLAAVSAAKAGEMTVTGNAHLTYTEVGNAVTGQPLGMKTNLSFVGSGELDGGQTFSVTIAHTDQATWSSANITLNTNSMGTLKLSSAEGGGGIGGYDDNMPRAAEEVWDAGAATNINLQKGVGSSMNLQWESPRIAATTLRLAWSPDNAGTQVNDKSTGGPTASDLGVGYDAVIRINPSFGAFGADLFVGYSESEKDNSATATGEKHDNRHREGVGGLTLDLGPLSVGGQISGEYMPTIGIGDNEYYANTSYGLAFNVNDDLSVSYGEIRSMVANNADIQQYTAKTEMTGESWQVAYTMGGISFKYADTEITNAKYSKGTNADAQLFIMSMAF
jgi:hypothetical protein